jgi:manganese transport protein
MADLQEKFHLPSIFLDRRFWAFFGTGLIVSVAYMDPGNWGTSISAGASYDYALIWAIWFSSGAAMLFQYISGKLGIAGHTIGDLIRQRWKDKRLVLAYWLAAEIAILATDLAEFLGIVVALHLLFGVPYLIGALIAVADVLLLMFLASRRFRLLEYAFILFVGVIGAGYVYELFITRPSASAIAHATLNPLLTPDTALLVVGIIGATVMPHALFVHSWLMKNKVLHESSKDIGKRKLLHFHTVEIVIALLIASFVNAAILIMAAAAFYANGIQVATIEEAYRTLTPLFGPIASLVFAVALLAAGISSSITGTLAGQSIMETLTDFKLSVTMRRIITRVINIIPTLLALYAGIEPLQILVMSQVVLSLMIPLPLIPLIYYSSKKEIMGEFANRRITTAAAVLLALIIFAFNAYLLCVTFLMG